MAIRMPPTIFTVEAEGGAAPASAPCRNGATRQITTNGAESAAKSHMEVVATTLTPAIFSSAHAVTTATPTITPRPFCPNHGISLVK